MKKVMMVLVAAVISAATQAATVQWKTGTVYAAIDKTGTSGSGTDPKLGATGHAGSVYVFYFGNETDFNDAKALSASKIYEDYILNTATKATAVTSGAASSFGKTLKLENQPDGSVNPVTIYGMMVLVDTATPTTDGYTDVDAFVKTAFQTGSYGDNVGKDFKDVAVAGNWTAYSAVPEPTSGLLLLLGVAGLALRRRRA